MYEYGTIFEYDDVKYIVVGQDIGENEIECISIPNDRCYCWFKIFEEDGIDKIRMI